MHIVDTGLSSETRKRFYARTLPV